MENEFSLLCSNILYLKKDFSVDKFVDTVSIWIADNFIKSDSIICENNNIIYDDNSTEEELQIKVSKDKKTVLVRLENHKKDEENKTYRVKLFFNVLQHLLQIELYCDKPSPTNPPKIIRSNFEF